MKLCCYHVFATVIFFLDNVLIYTKALWGPVYLFLHSVVYYILFFMLLHVGFFPAMYHFHDHNSADVHTQERRLATGVTSKLIFLSIAAEVASLLS